MIAEQANCTTPTPTLVNTLTTQLADVLMRPAVEALRESQCRNLRTRVERLISHGRIDAARALVSDSVTVDCLQLEIRRHLYEGCDRCPSIQEWCATVQHMERRESALLDLISEHGGY